MRRFSSLLFIALAALAVSGCILLPAPSGDPSSGPPPRSPSRGAEESRDLGRVAVGNNDTVRLSAGTYEGRLVVEANNATVVGAGIGRTVLRGDVVVDGNANTLRGLTIVGSVSISGNTNDLSGADVSRARVSARGNNNEY
jgi:hypothetical protein